MEILNYPVKYAVLGIEEQVGWISGLHELEPDYEMCDYIVSKVFWIGGKQQNI